MHRIARALLLFPLAAGALAGFSPDARAEYCDTVVFDDNPQDVILGVAGTHYPGSGMIPPFFIADPGLPLAVCYRENGGAWQMIPTSCDGDSTSDEKLLLTVNGGDDRVAVLRSAHLGSADSFPCGNEGAVGPWDGTGYLFGIYAVMGSGTDLFQGSPNADIAWTNSYEFTGWPPVGISPGDGSTFDKLCGGAGNDLLYGDDDDDYTIAEDWLDGGTGANTCDGDPWRDGNDVSDLWRNCTTHYDAYSDAMLTTPLIHCSDDDNPLTEW